jgi:hypothetical protein
LAFVATVSGVTAAQPRSGAQAIARVRAAQERRTERLLAIQDVVGTATGLDAAGRPAIKILLARTGVGGIPARLDGELVVTEVTGEIFALQTRPGKDKRPTVDAAIAAVDPNSLGSATLDLLSKWDGYGTPKSSIVAASSVGLLAQKYGRATGLTFGTITAINATVRVGYSSGTATFVNQIVVGPGAFSAGGDSGSLIVTSAPGTSDDRKPVGLLFAGSSSVTIANPIKAVLDSLGVTIDGE